MFTKCDSTKRFKFLIDRIIIGLSLGLAIAGSCTAQQPIATAQLDKETLIFLNLRYLDDQPVFELENFKWLIPTTLGPLRFDAVNQAFEYTELKAQESDFLINMTSVAKTGDRILVGTQRHGIYVFNPKNMSYETNYRVGSVRSFGTGMNLQLYQDPSTYDVWASTFLELHYFDRKSNKWSSLTHLFNRDPTSGHGLSNHHLFIDTPHVWLQAPYVVKSNDGLSQLDLINGQWQAYSQDTICGNKVSSMGGMRFLATKESLWLYFHFANSFNFYLSRFNKKAKQWDCYKGADAALAIEQLASELSTGRWIGKRPIVSQLTSVITTPLEKNHPYALSKEALIKLKNAVHKLKTAFSLADPNIDGVRGFPMHSIQKGLIVKGEQYGKNSTVMRLPPYMETRFNEVITSVGNSVLVETNFGLGLLDVAKQEMRLIKNTQGHGVPTNWIFQNNSQELLMCFHQPPDGLEDRSFSTTFRINLQNADATKLSTSINQACSGAKQELQKKLTLPSGDVVQLVRDGILLRKSKS